MKNLQVKPSSGFKGEITIPGDKSISHRAIMLGALARGETVVNNFLMSADCLATVKCFREMGVQIADSRKPNTEGRMIIIGKGLHGLAKPKELLDVGNSGTTIRLISGVLAGQDFVTKITGDESIQKRPMRRIADPLRQMGADIDGIRKGEELYPPLKITGSKLTPSSYSLPVASAQVKSAILLAGLFASGETMVVEKVRSRDHTERLLKYYGAEIKTAGHEAKITGQKEFDGAEINVPGDISSAAFFLVAGAIIKESVLLIRNVGVNSTRTGIIDVLHRMGAEIDIENERILSEEPRADIIINSSKLRGIKLDGEIIPRIIDEIPIIAVAATQAEGVTEIRGAKELRIKESDRIKTVAAELRKFGAKIEELEDGLKITGPTRLKGAKIESYGDHRIAMAMAVAGLIAEGETVIENSDCIETSFPGFETLLQKLWSR
ncbi:MAG: 3-phosphoshikimate 1-carboxyvinyltransferase [Candidatus Margulisbacteria bacterium]|nr:3-phosphoshikimate 1-carboxyvinyltransferase [Candidatus Margulisiibacteriota bacterium]